MCEYVELPGTVLCASTSSCLVQFSWYVLMMYFFRIIINYHRRSFLDFRLTFPHVINNIHIVNFNSPGARAKIITSSDPKHKYVLN